jgi:hypothetical protein
MTAAQKLWVRSQALIPKYAPMRKKAPWARLTTRSSPNVRLRPKANRNSSML